MTMDAQASKGRRRREQIMNVLKRQGRITIQEVVERFGVSEATARRDLEMMEKTEPVIRTIGGAMYDGMNAVRELPFAEKEGLSYLEKERIAAAAASLIEEGDVVGLSGGTTNYLLAKMLKTRRGITVVTNAVNVAMELAGSEIGVVVTGGMMRHNSFELCGPLGEGMIGQLNIGKMFLGVDGVSSTSGITTYSEQEAHIAKAMIRRAQATYAMFDHTKVGRTSLFSIASISELQGFITDAPLPHHLESAARLHGISVHVVE
ncbi:DeoR family transcriptional regulator of aga operon [Paenibacillus methanolicus]|uniref:DeoR family transcriptional regulator of aga operon n=2 Tax=Paenibacillus methanolicus TaxID=582686 RepID=A0A5S5BVE7_9BACL|nr:DeoR/GlpR family DNA-binding transcription regulator [Paenibacillus methanolicus]TYP71155.1 DeoR family transcriptional regulator of aga operon [Paenibacillus methanolicus]